MTILLRLIVLACGMLFVAAPAIATGIDLCPAGQRASPSSEQFRSAVVQLHMSVRERGADHPAFEPDWPQQIPDEPQGGKLCNLDLRGLNLSESDLHNFTIDNVTFSNANLDKVN